MNRRSWTLLLLGVLVAGSVLAQEETPDPLATARDAFKDGEYEKAVESADAVLASEPENPVAQYIAGTALLRLGRLDEAAQRLDALEQTAPKFPGLRFQLGYLAFSRAENIADQPGRAEDAKAFYATAAKEFAAELERNPEQPAVVSSRAIALGKAGMIDEALTAHDSWAALEPESNVPRISKGAFLAESGRAKEASEILDSLPQPDKATVAAAALAYGSTLYEKERFADAIPLLKKVLANDPGSARAEGLLVASYARLGDLENTSTELTAYLALGPSEADASQVGEVIREAFVNGQAARPAGVVWPTIRKLGSIRYPKNERDSRIRTEVLVIVRVLADGTPGAMDLVPNRIYREIKEKGFDEAAFEAVRRGKFEPGTRNGEAVTMPMVVTVIFEP